MIVSADLHISRKYRSCFRSVHRVSSPFLNLFYGLQGRHSSWKITLSSIFSSGFRKAFFGRLKFPALAKTAGRKSSIFSAVPQGNRQNLLETP